jgi:hypothetical protein
MTSQCLDRRIDTLEKLSGELEARQIQRNEQGKRQFTTEDARIKLHSLYPILYCLLVPVGKIGASDRRERTEGELVEKLRGLQEEHHGRYGAPRLQIELRKRGYG